MPYCSCVGGNGTLAQELIVLILREGCLPEPLGLVHGLVFGVNDRLLYIVHLQLTCPDVPGTGHALIVGMQCSLCKHYATPAFNMCQISLFQHAISTECMQQAQLHNACGHGGHVNVTFVFRFGSDSCKIRLRLDTISGWFVT